MFYIGDGTSYYPGVPMRNLTQTEWQALSPEVREALLNSKLFSGKEPEKPGVSVEQFQANEAKRAERLRAKAEAAREAANAKPSTEAKPASESAPSTPKGG